MDRSKGRETIEGSTDMLMEILLCLPSKSIFKFTCVSTRWNNIIMDPIFSKQYSKRTRRSLSSSYSGGRLLGLLEFNLKYGRNITPLPYEAVHRFMMVPSEEYFQGKVVAGYNMFTPHRGYFITTSKDGLYLCGFIPRQYFVGNSFIGKWETLPKPPPPQSFPHRALSVGLSSDDEDGVINFRLLIATGCDEHYEKSGSRVIPIETYSSRTRDWRKSKLLSEIPVAIQTGMAPTVSGGFFHWFTTTKRYIVAYDSSLLEEEDKGGKLKKKKQHVEVIEAPNTIGCQIVWRSDNGETMWFGSCNARDGVEVYRMRGNGDGWALISKVECVNRVSKEIIGITEEDMKNDSDRIAELQRFYQNLDPRMPREMVYLIAFMPWDPRLIILRVMERFFIFDCINQKIESEVELFGGPEITDYKFEWHPYFHSLSNSTYNFRHRMTEFYGYDYSRMRGFVY